MSEAVAMHKVTIEGYKRTRKITINPSEVGLTTLAGKNKQGKTSVLDAICHGLLGPKYVDRVQNIINTDAEKIEGTKGARARVQFELTDGTKIVRRFTDKNSRSGILEVTLPEGVEGSQENIDELFSNAALRIPNVESMSERERLRWLLAGLGIDISDLEEAYQDATQEKELAYQAKEQARRAFEDLPYHAEAPQGLVSMSDVTAEFEQAVEHNKLIENSASELRRAKAEQADISENIEDWKTQIERLNRKIKNAEEDQKEIEARIKKVSAKMNENQLIDIEDIKERMGKVESVNEKVRANQVKAEKEKEAEASKEKWRDAGTKQEKALAEMAKRIKGADVPLESLSVDFVNNQWVVTFDGQPWANMSGMQRIMAKVAIASLYNPNARLVLVDGLEALDEDMQEAFNAWLVERKLQSIATEVSSTVGRSNFVKLLIEDGTITEKGTK